MLHKMKEKGKCERETKTKQTKKEKNSTIF